MLCLASDLDAMFSAVFSGDRNPITPAKFLYSWWKHASNFASYEQQDAHEFFISVLDGIHERMLNDKGKTPRTQAAETVALLTEYFLESCGLMSCVRLVASHLLHMIHV